MILSLNEPLPLDCESHVCFSFSYPILSGQMYGVGSNQMSYFVQISYTKSKSLHSGILLVSPEGRYWFEKHSILYF